MSQCAKSDLDPLLCLLRLSDRVADLQDLVSILEAGVVRRAVHIGIDDFIGLKRHVVRNADTEARMAGDAVCIRMAVLGTSAHDDVLKAGVAVAGLNGQLEYRRVGSGPAHAALSTMNLEGDVFARAAVGPGLISTMSMSSRFRISL